MSTITPAPFTLANALLVVGTDNYEKAVSSVKFTPQSGVLTWKGLTPDSVYTDTSAPQWQCTIAFAQDWSTVNSLSQYLLTNAGQQKTVVFKPKGATTGSPIFTATVVIVPGAIGGDADKLLDDSVTLAVVGVPVKTTAP